MTSFLLTGHVTPSNCGEFSNCSPLMPPSRHRPLVELVAETTPALIPEGVTDVELFGYGHSACLGSS
jgi:hypothetical protein